RHLTDEVAHARARDRTHARAVPLDALVGDIGAASDDDARPFQEVGLVTAELVEKDVWLLFGRPSFRRGEVDEHHEHASALDVAQEAMPEAATLARAFD